MEPPRSDTTRASLLMRVRDQSNERAWREFVALYRPLLVRFAQARGLSKPDADDVAQDTLALLMRKMPEFEYDRHKGGFKRWLRAVVSFRVREHLRKRRDHSADTDDFARPQKRERTPEEAWERIWLQEHLRYSLEQIRPRMEAKTHAAFCRLVLDEWPVAKVCEALGLTANQVYIAKSRVGRQLRTFMVQLLGHDV